MKPATFALLLGGGATIVALSWDRHRPQPSTTPLISDPEVLLCDRAVEALLHSKELIEVERAGIIIQQVNCGIGKRL
jgi:hypothetical protein